MANQGTQAVFDATAATYDQDRMRLIPGWQAFYSAALELIPTDAKRIVELGAGSGLFSAMIRAAHPRAELWMVDFSEPMLKRAKERLGDAPGLHYVLSDYLETALPGEADAVVSALSIHHLEDADKQRIIRNAFAALRAGGVFVNADHIAGPTGAMEREYVDRWLSAIQVAGATEQQIKDSLFRQQEDRRSPVEAQLGWLREAGFTDVDCWYKASSFAVLRGIREIA